MIIFFGPAGAGKSVQGQLLAARHGWRWLSAGQLLRDTHDPEVLETMRAGKMVEDDKVNAIIAEALKRAKDVDRVILDGFPRELSQARWLLETQEEHERAISLVILLNVPRDELEHRLSIRGRLDDTPDVIEERLNQYTEQTGQILDLFTAHDIIIKVVDGTGSVGTVHDRIEAELQSAGLSTSAEETNDASH